MAAFFDGFLFFFFEAALFRPPRGARLFRVRPRGRGSGRSLQQVRHIWRLRSIRKGEWTTRVDRCEGGAKVVFKSARLDAKTSHWASAERSLGVSGVTWCSPAARSASPMRLSVLFPAFDQRTLLNFRGSRKPLPVVKFCSDR